MANSHEKLSGALTLRIDPEQLQRFKELAEANGDEHPELVRAFIDSYVEREKNKYAVLNRIFGQDEK